MRDTKALLACCVAALALALAGCTPGQPAVSANERVAAEDRTEEGGAGGEAPAPTGPVVTFAAGNQIAWTEEPSEAPAGEVTVELVCEGLAHNVVIEGVNSDQPIVECDAAGTFTGTTELQPGTYGYHCAIPGHEAGMSGEMTVS